MSLSEKNKLDKLSTLWSKIDSEYKYSRNESILRNGWILGQFIGNPELDLICSNSNILNLVNLAYSFKEMNDEEFNAKFNDLPENVEKYQVVNFNEKFPMKDGSDLALNREEAIKEIKELIKNDSEYTFTATGYCPVENEDEDLTGDGHYWTQWDDLTSEELIDKLSDHNYQIEVWICNELSNEMEL
ncbi:hypothetical protein SSYRP_v1c04590 [Spiroplasma syrphidicola EA-1]|uniref:Uncharacterized protein n=1 Tax=Spiroplasma syrphidicola EA-1 TaxID=1276229 RepID=R4ULC0_9MOLU|nr:hypothetical protein [Spiroplasma syrphidicola]AGM26051.1 hypothetical protein SSYRP_v1c04590 [Spiroplasma syrphidicola EA-1]